MTEDDLITRITGLENDLARKEHEIIGYLGKIEHLEDTIMRLEALIPDESSKDSKKKRKKRRDSKLKIEFDEKEKEVRELKNKMGILRQKKIQLQQELEKFTNKKKNSTVIRIEEKKEPLETLVKDLQDKINKQQALITKLKEESKKEKIDSLKLKISELEKQLEKTRSIGGCKIEDLPAISLREELRKRLKMAKRKRQAKSIKRKLEKLEKKQRKHGIIEYELAINNLRKKIEKFKVELIEKDINIVELNNLISALKKTQEELAPNQANASVGLPILDLTEELQKKLNKAKSKIKILQNQLIDYNLGKAAVEEVKSREQIINELRSKLESLDVLIQPVPTSDPHIALRWRELKNIIKDLNKQNIQQRLEISELRKNYK